VTSQRRSAPADGCVVQVRRGARRYLLDESTEAWHTPEQRWGKGFAITDVGAGRWDAPAELEIAGETVSARYEVTAALTLDVERRFGDTWSERYAFRGAAPLTLLTVGIQTPFRDVYASAADALPGAVHAHLWPGGSYSFALAQPMDGSGPLLGLHTRAGALWAYSIESREERQTGSNARGHIVLHPTDAGRARHAFGGQPRIALATGESYVLEWELAWYESVAAFLAAHPPPAVAKLTAPLGEPISVGGRELRSETEGERYLDADVRMRDIAIRHWDGYWFVGDFKPDGTATAGFVMPSCVSGRVAHRADPVANDQDWALYWPLLLGGRPGDREGAARR
jgi:hypothetical protein